MKMTKRGMTITLLIDISVLCLIIIAVIFGVAYKRYNENQSTNGSTTETAQTTYLEEHTTLPEATLGAHKWPTTNGINPSDKVAEPTIKAPESSITQHTEAWNKTPLVIQGTKNTTKITQQTTKKATNTAKATSSTKITSTTKATNATKVTSTTKATSTTKTTTTKNKEFSLSIGNITCQAGKSIKVPVYIENNPGIWSVVADFAYDNSVLTLTGYENGNVFEANEILVGPLTNKDFTYTACATAFGNNKKSGTLLYLCFNVSKSASNKNISISFNNIDSGDIINVDSNDVIPKYNNGKITIK